MDSPAASKYVQLYQYKPYLDENLVLPPWRSKSDKPHNISFQDAISDYLKVFHEYVAEKILQQFGPSFSRRSFRYCLTVPAMWSDKAKGVMRKAAVKANIITENDHPDRLMLVSEPEAAALYCERMCKQFDLNNGDRFMICDAGGGTVDLIVYEIASTIQRRRLSEVTKGHGASCGSMFIDLEFGSLLAGKLASQGADIPKNVIPTLLETFAYQLKPHFDGIEDHYLPLPRSDCFNSLQDPETIGIDDGYMCLEASELKELVFESVVKNVLALIQGQLNGAKDCSAIFMAGGFDSSSYLLNRAKQEFSDAVKTISAPNRPELAVVCGAVYVGLNPKIVSARVSRRCYGIDMFEPFEEGVDPISKRVIRFDGVWCSDRFSTFVKRGQTVQIDECATHKYAYTNVGSSADSFSLDIFAIDGCPPRYSTDVGVAKLATNSIPNPFRPMDRLGHMVNTDVKMYFGLNEIKTEGFIQGKRYSTTLRFDSSDVY
ncbi:hypothetical protein BGZ46_006647 [Entomortierella lignicola]|nr:hypothetical protein BGZ46_006647 [Entomortierella lignicola]